MKRTRNFLQLVTFYCCEIHKTNPLLSDWSFSDRTWMFVCFFRFHQLDMVGVFFVFFSAAVCLTGGWTVCSPAGRSGQSVVSVTPHWKKKKKNHMRSASICHGGRACFTPHAQTDNLWRRKRDVRVIIWSSEIDLERIRAEKNKITSLQCVNVESRIFLTVFRNQLRLSITGAFVWFITKRKQSRLPTDFHRRQQLPFNWPHHPTKITVKISTISVLFYSA